MCNINFPLQMLFSSEDYCPGTSVYILLCEIAGSGFLVLHTYTADLLENHGFLLRSIAQRQILNFLVGLLVR
jgi:hypothetical protein